MHRNKIARISLRGATSRGRGATSRGRAISATGHNVVVDTVFERPEWLQHGLEQFKGCSALYVGVHCRPEEPTRREREGLDACAEQIRAALDS